MRRKKIGILGGGQLGRMFIAEAIKYDDEIHTLDPSPVAPCRHLSIFTEGDFSDYQAVIDFGKGLDVISIEIEHVNVQALYALEKMGKTVIPKPDVIEMIQHKTKQKDFYQAHQIPTPAYKNIQNASEINFPLPFVQKMDTGGYDGKGVQIIRTEEDLKNLWDAPSVIEKMVEIEKELSIIIGIGTVGDQAWFPVTEMVADPVLNLLDFNVCPAEIDTQVEDQIHSIAQKMAAALASPGLFAIELLLDRDGKVWVNETAPRLHNSGHLTQEGCTHSQFEQFYRIISGAPLAQPKAMTHSGMLNLVGAENHSGPVHYQGLREVMRLPYAYVHLYGKDTTQPGRKMGHINILAATRKQLEERLSQVKAMVKVVSE